MRILQRHRQALLWNVIAVAPLFVYAFNTIYTRFMFDDFCLHNEALAYGAFGLSQLVYEQWMGRFVTIFAHGLVAYIPPQLAPLVAIGFLIVWWLAIFILARFILRRRGVSKTGTFAGVASSLLILATLAGAANPIQTVYWQTVILTYLLPIFLGTLFVWVLLQDSLNRLLSLTLCAVLPFLAAGCAETYALMQTGLIILVAPIFWRRPQFRRLTVAFIFSALSFLIVVLAPGNAVRQATYPRPNLARAIQGSIISAGIPEVISFKLSPLPCVALLVLPALVAYFYDTGTNDKSRLYILATIMIMILLSMAAFMTAFYATSNVPPSRTLIMVQYIMLWGLALIGYFAGLSLRSVQLSVHVSLFRPFVYGAIVLMLAGSVVAIGQGFSVMQQLKWYAQLWDQRDAKIRTYHAEHPDSTQPIMVPYIPDRFDIVEASADPSFTVNQCIARYYDVTAIATYPPTQ